MTKFVIPDKICYSCKKKLPIHEFGVITKSKDGFNRNCKHCMNEKKKKSELQKLREINRPSYGKSKSPWFGKI